jgi:2-C-methyl-D-erythritol 4-phosphate cytidylyltransferase
MRITAIIPAAGCGRRMKSGEDKPFIKVCGREIICYSLTAMERIPAISEVIIVAKKKNIPRVQAIADREGFKKVKNIVSGGRLRCESVLNGLKASDEYSDYILIHDCARPLVEKDIIENTIKSALKNNSAIAAVKVKPTIKQVFSNKGFIRNTLIRELLWEAQTPQVFKAGVIKEAYSKAGKAMINFTDDSGLVENAGHKVKIVESSYRNIKITTREDLIIAEALLKGSIKLRKNEL